MTETPTTTGTAIVPVDMTKKRKVTLMEASPLVYPELFLEVYVVSHGNPYEERNFAQIFAKAKCTKANSPEEADLVVFVGGVDVDPALYDLEDPDLWHPTQDEPDRNREDADQAIYIKCLNLGIPMLGVCRGAQLLHVYNGGALYQHIDGHSGAHSAWELTGKHKRMIRVSSVHHQACMPNPQGGMLVLMDAYGSNIRCRNGRQTETGSKPTIEAFYYRDTLCLGVQFHPEYAGYDESAVWTMNRIKEFYMDSDDVVLDGKYRRLKPEIMAERSAEWARLAEAQREDEDGPAEDPDDLLDDDIDWGVSENDNDLVRAGLPISLSGYDLDPAMDDEDYEEIVNETMRQQQVEA